MNNLYQDRWIECGPDALRIRGYYFPWGSKRIPYGKIRGIRQVTMNAFTGKARIWGTANPRYWASLDPGRPSKEAGLVLDLGRFVHPFITPDDPQAVETVVRQRTSLDPAEADSGRAPLL